MLAGVSNPNYNKVTARHHVPYMCIYLRTDNIENNFRYSNCNENLSWVFPNGRKPGFKISSVISVRPYAIATYLQIGWPLVDMEAWFIRAHVTQNTMNK